LLTDNRTIRTVITFVGIYAIWFVWTRPSKVDDTVVEAPA
jgi:hypothetical protein